jgi:hypothetical protein
MPLWLRRATWNLINEYNRQQQEKAEGEQNALKATKNNEIAKPNITPQPTYTTKSPKKP